MEILYGIEENYVNVTDIVNEYLSEHDSFVIPKSDNERASLFADHIPGVLKHIKIDRIYNNNESITLVLDEEGDIKIDKVENLSIQRKQWWGTVGKNVSNPNDKLRALHNYMVLDYGTFNDEFPEQLMAINHIKETDTVLEIGGNIGRNTCVIASILNDDRRFVTLESHPDISKQLEHNRNKNGFNFFIEASALSKVSLIQKDWNTVVSEIVHPGYIKIPTITYDELMTKYNLTFNVLVADCEGALYQILQDEPKLLSTIETIIIENDFTDITKKEYVDEIFLENGFKVIYSEAGGWGPCYSCFFQVWSKN